MNPDDPRHGTEAGAEQHHRDGAEPCAACYDAKLRASRRRTKLKTMGHKFRAPVGDRLYGRLLRLHARGASHHMIANWAGLSQPLISRIYRQGPEAVISTRTHDALRTMQIRLPVTPIGATRRIQSLAALGYSTDRVARESGLHEETVKEMRKRPGAQIMSTTAEKIAGTYERLSMTHATSTNRQVSAGISRSRNTARREGWPPPLAWNDIDDPTETPEDWGYKEAAVNESRLVALQDLIDSGANISRATKALGCSREALEVWCRRRNLSGLYLTLTAREGRNSNQYSEEVA